MRLTTTLMLSSVMALRPGAVQAQDPLRGFDRYVAEAVRTWEAPGLAIGIVKSGEVVFAKGYGVLELGRAAPVTTRTMFANASTTKAFNAMVIAMLVDDGLLDWDDRVADHLPHFAMSDPYVTREVRVRDLLSHRVGFGDPQFLWYGKDDTLDEMLRRLQHVEPRSSFRSHYAYNNIAVAAAGTIAGRVSGAGWDALVHDRILAPLGMTSTVTRARDLPATAEIAVTHGRVDGQVVPIRVWGLVDSIPAAGSMYSNVDDMTRWIRFLLDEGRVGDDTLVSRASFDEIFQPQTIIRAGQSYPTELRTRPHFTAYGLGWFLQDYRGHKIAFHTGSIDGTVAIVGLLPALELGVVVFANRDHMEVRHALMLQVFDRFIGAPVRDWSAELTVLYDSLAADSRSTMDRLRESRVEGTSSSHPLEAYTGHYTDRLYGDVAVTLVDGHLVLRASEYLSADLEHFQFDTFEARWHRAWLGSDPVTFSLGADGRVTGMQLGQQRYRKVQPNEP